MFTRSLINLGCISFLLCFASCAKAQLYDGTIGNYKIEMEINITNDPSTVQGRYRYAGKKDWIMIKGYKDEPVIKMNEFVNNQQTGFFNMKYDEAFMIGTWQKSQGAKPLKVTLKMRGSIAADNDESTSAGNTGASYVEFQQLKKYLHQFPELRQGLFLEIVGHDIEDQLMKSATYLVNDSIEVNAIGKISGDGSTDFYLAMESASGIAGEYKLVIYEWNKKQPLQDAFATVAIDTHFFVNGPFKNNRIRISLDAAEMLITAVDEHNREEQFYQNVYRGDNNNTQGEWHGLGQYDWDNLYRTEVKEYMHRK